MTWQQWLARHRPWPCRRKVSLRKTRSTEAAMAAARVAQRRLVETQASWPEINRTVTRLRDYREENHLSDMILETFGRSTGGHREDR